jgi:predicted transcriptional regulator
MKAKDILAVKGSRVITTHQDNTVMEAIALFFINRVGSLIIVDEHDHIKGILAPNDILKAVHTDLDNIRQAKVSQFMSKDLIVA